MIVIDASALVNALVRPTPPLVARISREAALHGPQLLPLEVASALRRLAGTGKLSDAGAWSALASLSRLALQLHPHLPLLARLWELRSTMTVYDGAYVALAEALDLPLLTSDARLFRTVGPRCAVELL